MGYLLVIFLKLECRVPDGARNHVIQTFSLIFLMVVARTHSTPTTRIQNHMLHSLKVAIKLNVQLWFMMYVCQCLQKGQIKDVLYFTIT